MKGDGAAIPSSRFLRCPEPRLITLCSHASPPPSPRSRPSRPDQSRPRPPSRLANGGGRDAGTCELREMFPVTHSRASLRLGRPHPSVPASEDLPRRPPPPLVCLPARALPALPLLPLPCLPALLSSPSASLLPAFSLFTLPFFGVEAFTHTCAVYCSLRKGGRDYAIALLATFP